MKKIILASAMAMAMIGCNKDKKAEAAATPAPENKAPVFTVINLTDFGDGEILKICRSYTGKDTAAFRKATVQDVKIPVGQLGHTEQVYSTNPCPTENLVGVCANADIDSLKGQKEDQYLYKLKVESHTQEIVEMMAKDCASKLHGVFSKK